MDLLLIVNFFAFLAQATVVFNLNLLKTTYFSVLPIMQLPQYILLALNLAVLVTRHYKSTGIYNFIPLVKMLSSIEFVLIVI